MSISMLSMEETVFSSPCPSLMVVLSKLSEDSTIDLITIISKLVKEIKSITMSKVNLINANILS